MGFLVGGAGGEGGSASGRTPHGHPSAQLAWASRGAALVSYVGASGGLVLSLFVLREGYRVITTSSGGRLVRDADDRAVDLTPLEVQLLARTNAGGIDTSEPAAEALVTKLKEFVALVPRPATTAETPLVAKGTPDERATVPLFRRDLRIDPSPTSGSVFQVTRPDSGRSFSLYDFELSLARMLDGHRRYFEAVDAGQRLGIPVSLESLGQFVRELDGYGFLESPEEAAEPHPNVRESRRAWDDSMRALFQSGLRLTRQGRYGEAASYFEAMLAQDPQTPEATEMLNRVRQRLASPASAKPSSSSTRAPATTLDLPITVVSEAELMSGDPSSSLLPELGGPESYNLPTDVSAETAFYNSASSPEEPSMPHSDEPEDPEIPSEEHQEEPALDSQVEEQFFEGEQNSEDSEHLGAEGPTQVSDEDVDEPSNGPRWGLRIFLIVLVLAGVGVGVMLFMPGGRLGKGSGSRTSARDSRTSATDHSSTSTAATSASASNTAASTRVDAGTASTATAETSHDAGPSAVAAVTPPAVPNSATPTAPDVSWNSAPVTRRTRPVQGKIRASAAGVIEWKAKRGQLVARGEMLGVILKKPSGPKARDIRAAKPGIFLPSIGDGKKIRSGQVIASLANSQASAQARFKGQKPKPGWRCEVVDPKLDEHAPCHIKSATGHGKVFLVTVTTDATWIDHARGAQVRIADQ